MTKKNLLDLYHIAKLVAATAWYALTRRNLPGTQHSLIALHALSNGRSTELLARWLGRRPLPELERSSAADAGSVVFPGADRAARESWKARVAAAGFCVCPGRLPAPACDELLQFARSARGAEWTAAGPTSRSVRLAELSASAAKLQFEADDLIAQPAVQRLVSDPGLLAFLQDCFGAAPVLDSVGMWWSIASQQDAASEIAQLFHFDLDRPQWLKLFVYLTDVDPDTGPHVFVEGSQLREERRAGLLRRGYVRIADEDIAAAYGKERIHEICGPAGTFLLANTLGFHKGKVPRRADRLILELQFCSSTFGVDYPRMRLAAPPAPPLRATMARCPSVYQALETA